METVVEAQIHPPAGTAWQPKRIDGFDLARALAVMAMVLVNYKAYMQVGTITPLWLNALVDFIFGRAATIFVILAGASVTLMFQRQSLTGSPGELRRYLWVRSMLLLLAGLFFRHWWPADIFHFYALYIALGALLAGWPERSLRWLTVAVGIISLPVCAQLTAAYDVMDHLAGLQGRSWFFRLAADYLVSNYYPIFPWFAYFLVGMLLGRREPAGDSFHRRLLVVGATVCVAVELLSAALLAWAERYDLTVEGQWGLAFLRSEAFPATPLFVFSSIAGGLAVISLCRLVAAHSGRGVILDALYKFGRLSLSLYVGHLLWGFGFLAWIEAHGGRISQARMFASVGGFWLAGICIAVVWCRYFKRGPLEMLLYRMARLEWPKPRRVADIPEA